MEGISIIKAKLFFGCFFVFVMLAATTATAQVYNYDANGDGFLYYDDVDTVIDHLNTHGFTCYPDPNYSFWVDVNLDFCNTPEDVLILINFFNGNPWQNPTNQFDVNGDGYVTALDVMTLINAAINGHAEKFTLNEAYSAPFLDVNGDNLFTEDDIDDLIAYLNG